MRVNAFHMLLTADHGNTESYVRWSKVGGERLACVPAYLIGKNISHEDCNWLASLACLLHLVQQAQVAGVLHAPKRLAGYL